MVLLFNAVACKLMPMSDQIPQHAQAWKAISRAHAKGRAQIDAALKAQNLPPLETYEALSSLVDGTSTAKALETQLSMPQYAVSRLLDRMERDNLVTRAPSRSDQRAKTIEVTDKGRAVMQAQLGAYTAALAEYLAPRAKPGQLERITALLALLDTDDDGT